MLPRAFAAGFPAEWVVGDTVYGYDECAGGWRGRTALCGGGAETHASGWRGNSARRVPRRPACPGLDTALGGGGQQGAALYDWAWLALPEQRTAGAGAGCWRGAAGDPSKLAYYRVYGPAQTTWRDGEGGGPALDD